MRSLTIAAVAVAALTGAMPADAQQASQGARMMRPQIGMPRPSMPAPVAHPMPQAPRPPMPGRPGGWSGGSNGGGQWHGGGANNGQWHGGSNGGGNWSGGSHWGGSTGGRWQGGWNAPGGWNAYRRPSRGWRLPSYWIAPSFFISDYGLYGLAPPPYGYNWSRYYDDAVLIDTRGKVRDYVGGVNWDGYADGYGSDDGYVEGGYDQGGYAQGAPYPAPGYGPGPRAGYPAPGGPGYRSLPPITANGGVTTYSTGGYYARGYYYPGATTTTVVVQSAPSVTTTTTEYVERTRYVAKKVWRKPVRKWHPKPKVECVCGS